MTEKTLVEFLLGNPVNNTIKELVISERLKDFKFKIKSLSGQESDEIAQKAKGKNGVHRMESYYILAACVYPDFTNAESIKSAGCGTPLDLLDKVLLPGEQNTLYMAISEVSGFTGFKTMVEDVKN